MQTKLCAICLLTNPADEQRIFATHRVVTRMNCVCAVTHITQKSEALPRAKAQNQRLALFAFLTARGRVGNRGDPRSLARKLLKMQKVPSD